MGTGEDINISGQPWLQDVCNPYVTTVSQALENKKVASLLCTDNKEWDIDVIRDVFNVKDQHCILIIPLNADNVEDTMYWTFKATRNY